MVGGRGFEECKDWRAGVRGNWIGAEQLFAAVLGKDLMDWKSGDGNLV